MEHEIDHTAGAEPKAFEGFPGIFGGGSIPIKEPQEGPTELQELLIGENPRRRWGEYHAENRKRRSAGLPVGNFPMLVNDDEQEWRKDMAFLGTRTIEQGLAENPMPRSLFEDTQATAHKWGMGDLVPHRWINGEWFLSAPFSLVPRFRIPLRDILTARGQMEDMVVDFQIALIAIGEQPAKFHPGHGPSIDIKGRLKDGERRRREGCYFRFRVRNVVLRLGMVGYPVILPGVDYEGGAK